MSQLVSPSHARRAGLHRRRIAAWLAIGVGAMAGWGPASAADVVRMLVPFPAGGAADFLARTLAEKLKAESGQTVVVENKPGAGGRLAAEALKQSKGDGETLLLAAMEPMVIAPAIHEHLRFKPETDFKPVTDVASFVFCVAVAGDSPHRTLADYLRAASASRDAATIGITSPGTVSHFFAFDFGRTARLDHMTLVPFLGGPALITNLVGGQVPAVIDGTTVFTEQHRAKKLRLLAVSAAQRLPGLPEVPTFVESGYPSLVAGGTTVLYVPASTPPAKVAMWNAAVRKVLAMPDVRARLEQGGYMVSKGSTPEEVVALTRKTAERLLPIVKASGFKAE